MADGDEILGKPRDAEEARIVLTSLRGRVHQVYTALAVYDPAADGWSLNWRPPMCPCGNIPMKRLKPTSPPEIPFDKAGSYAIQHPEFRPVDTSDWLLCQCGRAAALPSGAGGCSSWEFLRLMVFRLFASLRLRMNAPFLSRCKKEYYEYQRPEKSTGFCAYHFCDIAVLALAVLLGEL